MACARTAVLRAIGGLAAVVVGIAAVAPGASASSVTYGLIPGQGFLTAVTIGDSTTNLLSGMVALDNSTSLTADFAFDPLDPTVAQLENLFISASSGGVLNLGGGNSLAFSNATLDTIGTNLASGGPLYTFSNWDAQVDAIFSLNGGAATPYSNVFQVGGTVQLLSDGLNIVLRGATLGATQDGQEIKGDFSFRARAVSGETAIPEPGSGLLFGVGMLVLGWAARAKGERAA
jgi:hypothetical protein